MVFGDCTNNNLECIDIATGMNVDVMGENVNINDDHHDDYHMNHPSKLMADPVIDHNPAFDYTIDQAGAIAKLPNDIDATG